MEPNYFVRSLFFFCLFVAIGHAVESRSWTDLQDRKIEATLLQVDGQNVILQLKDGRKIPYPLAKLSASDGQYVEQARSQLAEGKNAAAGDLLNFDAPWPDHVKFSQDPEINTVEENAEKKNFVYESANYRYLCDARLGKSVVKGFAVMFEATLLYCRSLPLAIDGGEKVDGKYQIQLFEQQDDYIKAGGMPGSAGVFIRSRKVVLAPVSSLGVKPVGSGYMLDREKSSKTLPHELTHQLTPDAYFEKGALGWFSEGIAEHVANTPYRSGDYNVRGNQKDIIENTTGYGAKDRGGRALGNKISLSDLKKFMLQDYASFFEEGQLNYGCGLLLTNYFLHMDGAGDGKRIKTYLKALQDGKNAEKSMDLLLDGRSFEQLQDDVSKAWKRRGIDFTFAAP